MHKKTATQLVTINSICISVSVDIYFNFFPMTNPFDKGRKEDENELSNPALAIELNRIAIF